MSGFKQMSWNDWINEYKPIIKDPKNLDPTNWENEDYSLETYGLELQCVRFMMCFFPNHVWTYCDDGEEGFVSDGYHFVNRLNYFVTEKPKLPNVCYEIV